MNLKKYEHIMRVCFGKPYYPSEGELIQKNNFHDFEKKTKSFCQKFLNCFTWNIMVAALVMRSF